MFVENLTNRSQLNYLSAPACPIQMTDWMFQVDRSLEINEEKKTNLVFIRQTICTMRKKIQCAKISKAEESSYHPHHLLYCDSGQVIADVVGCHHPSSMMMMMTID